MTVKLIEAAALTLLLTAVVVAAESADHANDELDRLDRDALVELVSDKTAECRKEKDGSLCANYFSDDGVIKRVMYDDGARRDGVWFVDDQERLCILWTGKIKPLCFSVLEQDDGSYNLIKRGKHITTILGTEDGNTKDL